MNADMKKCLILSGPNQLSRTTAACAQTRLTATHKPNSWFTLSVLALVVVLRHAARSSISPQLDVCPSLCAKPDASVQRARDRAPRTMPREPHAATQQAARQPIVVASRGRSG